MTPLAWLPGAAGTVVAAPLDPSPQEAREAVRRELLSPEYARDDLLQRVLDWIARRLEGAGDLAAGSPPLTWFAVTALTVLLVAAVVALATRARRSGRSRTDRAAAVLDQRLTAAELRERARSALAQERYDDAVVDGFRALAVAAVEDGRLADSPSATAHEVAARLAADADPAHAGDLARSADDFDAVLYGDRVADAATAHRVLDLDRALAGRR